jgi:hypothetical protein
VALWVNEVFSDPMASMLDYRLQVGTLEWNLFDPV